MTGVADLVEALLFAREYRNASPELRDYAGHRYVAMAKAFGLGDPPPIEHVDPWGSDLRPGAKRLLIEGLNSFEQLGSPFDGYLEASGEVAALWQSHGRPIDVALSSVRAAVCALLVDALVLGWGLPAGTTVTDDELRACGFDPDVEAPDPDDFF